MFSKLLIISCIICFSYVRAFSSWFAEEYCDTPLIEGQSIMSHDATLSLHRLVEVYRISSDNTKQLMHSGESYEPGETLEITLNGKDVGELVFEASHPILEYGGCDGRRSTITTSRAVIPKDFTETLEIWAGVFSYWYFN